jgi:hypothetical protein
MIEPVLVLPPERIKTLNFVQSSKISWLSVHPSFFAL